jgi:hypothetical protein
MQGSQYPEWRQAAAAFDGLQEEKRWGLREKRPDMPSHREVPLRVLLPVPLPVPLWPE